MDGRSLVGLRSVLFEAGDCEFAANEAFVFDRNGTKIIRALNVDTIVVVPKHVETLGCGCFSHIQSLREVIFEAGAVVRAIEPMAFAFSWMQLFTIPATVELCPRSAFTHCRSLKMLQSDNPAFQEMCFDIMRGVRKPT
jgi:hypothetical protein